ncbi:hypothetical protein ARMGADRAFT_1061615 [Armillaria gallica]|uniref:Uncharacterized protein n=1 Tax=Armillaria gallica TaxID=47427 RepID=A0A2H3DKN9_ARMGA|nr:hypothetical protein ARMGADRAFT_1061615 [Armillaria gallica]
MNRRGLRTLPENFNSSILEKIRSVTRTLTFIVQAEQYKVLVAPLLWKYRLDSTPTVDKDIHSKAVLEVAHASGGDDNNEHTPRCYVACAIATAGQDNNLERQIELINARPKHHYC